MLIWEFFLANIDNMLMITAINTIYTYILYCEIVKSMVNIKKYVIKTLVINNIMLPRDIT